MKRHSSIGKVISNIKRVRTQQEKEQWSSKKLTFSNDVHENKQFITKQFGESPDLIFTEFSVSLPKNKKLKALLVAIDGLVDEEAKRNNILKPLKSNSLKTVPNESLDEVQELLSTKQVTVEDNLSKAIYELLKSKALLIVDTYEKALLISIEGYEIRSIEEPETEQAVRGAREGFIEAPSVNISMIRRRISHPSLHFETVTIGEFSQTDITLAYIKGIVDPKIVHRVKERLKKIETDAIHSAGEVEQLIEDHPFSIFPTIGNTERPDTAAALLMGGRVIVFVNGSPIGLYIPFQFIESVKTIEDYNSRPYYASFIRFLRFFAFLLSISLPSLYISALNFNKALIPSDLIVPIIQAREMVPFPLTMEVLLMIFMFEVVREAGVRLPKQVGSALSIVGALILGEVSVSAGLVGAPTIVVVSLSYIAAFVITPIADVTALLRIGLFLASSLFGSYGLIVALLGLLTHMVSLTSLGVPYMAPFSPTHFQDWKDSFVRFPTKMLKLRSDSIPNKRPTRIKSTPDTGDKQ